jgi:hypothetical protein
MASSDHVCTYGPLSVSILNVKFSCCKCGSFFVVLERQRTREITAFDVIRFSGQRWLRMRDPTDARSADDRSKDQCQRPSRPAVPNRRGLIAESCCPAAREIASLPVHSCGQVSMLRFELGVSLANLHVGRSRKHHQHKQERDGDDSNGEFHRNISGQKSQAGRIAPTGVWKSDDSLMRSSAAGSFG